MKNIALVYRQKERIKALRAEVDILTLNGNPYSTNLKYGNGRVYVIYPLLPHLLLVVCD